MKLTKRELEREKYLGYHKNSNILKNIWKKYSQILTNSNQISRLICLLLKDNKKKLKIHFQMKFLIEQTFLFQNQFSVYFFVWEKSPVFNLIFRKTFWYIVEKTALGRINSIFSWDLHLTSLKMESVLLVVFHETTRTFVYFSTTRFSRILTGDFLCPTWLRLVPLPRFESGDRDNMFITTNYLVQNSTRFLMNGFVVKNGICMLIDKIPGELCNPHDLCIRCLLCTQQSGIMNGTPTSWGPEWRWTKFLEKFSCITKSITVTIFTFHEMIV